MLFVVPFVAMVTFVVGGTLLDQRRLRRQGFRRSQEPPVLMSPHQFGPDALVARTGARIGWWNASDPLITITVDASWVRVQGMPTYFDVWIERTRVHSIGLIRGWLFGRGLIFRTEDGAFDGVIVWIAYVSDGAILTSLSDFGWPDPQEN